MMKREKKNKTLNNIRRVIADLPPYMYVVIIAALLILVIGMCIAIARNTPTKETLSLEDYYNVTADNEMVVICNGSFKEKDENADYVDGLFLDGKAYISITYLKKYIDNGYVYDKTEGILRYTTDSQIISASIDSNTYTVDKEQVTLDAPVITRDSGEYYINLEFVSKITDMTYEIYDTPARVVIETAGLEKNVSVVKRNTQVRKNGGVKSKVLAQVSKKDQVSVIQNYGKWSQVVTKDGVVGYIKNSKLKKAEAQVVANNLPERKYNHITVNDNIVMAWHQVTNKSANANVSEVLANTSVNVVSPTWFYMDDNQGGIANLASSSYVDYCHSNNIKVWALFSNLENKNVDTATVLNITSSRDALINNLVAAAITYNLDGINVDIEALPEGAADGYLEFIKELSVKCENNNIVLSVDLATMGQSYGNYNPEVLPDYVDYGIIMAYDEHTTGDEPGSVSSITFVRDCVQSCLKTFDKSQVVLGLPFYTRVWTITGNDVTAKAYSMKNIGDFISTHNGNPVWNESTAQNYAEMTEGDTTYKVWLEDANSISQKLQVAVDNELAGVSFWKLTQEVPEIWQTIATYSK